MGAETEKILRREGKISKNFWMWKVEEIGTQPFLSYKFKTVSLVCHTEFTKSPGIEKILIPEWKADSSSYHGIRPLHTLYWFNWAYIISFSKKSSALVPYFPGHQGLTDFSHNHTVESDTISTWNVLILWKPLNKTCLLIIF